MASQREHAANLTSRASSPSTLRTRRAPERGSRQLHRFTAFPCFLTTITILLLRLLPQACARREGLQFGPDGIPLVKPVVIAQGGARGESPLYTLQAYRKALEEGMRTLECKVGITKQGHPVCVAGLNLEYISDIKPKSLRQFPHLYTPHLRLNEREPTYDGWFIFNFTTKVLQTVHLFNDVRPVRLLVNGRHSERKVWLPWARVPTLREVLEMVMDWAEHDGKSQTPPPPPPRSSNLKDENLDLALIRPQHDIRIILEPLYAGFVEREFGHRVDQILLKTLSRYNLVPSTPPANTTEVPWERPRIAVHVQSREANLLRTIKKQAPLLPLIQVLDVDWDQPNASFPIFEEAGRNTDEWRERSWDEIWSYAWAVSVSKDLLLPRDKNNYLAVPPVTEGMLPGGPVMKAARARNLTVFTWSFCEASGWPMAYDFNEDPYAEHDAFVEGVGVDGFFTACPATSTRYLESRVCLELLAAGQRPISAEQLGWTELLVLGIMVVIAVLPMGAGLVYAIYKWRESEQFMHWQEFTTGIYGGGQGGGRTREGGMMMAAMGPSAKELEKVPLTEEEWDRNGAPDRSLKARETAGEGDGLSLLTDGAVAEEGKGTQKQQGSGTWRMRRGAEWNSDEVWS